MNCSPRRLQGSSVARRSSRSRRAECSPIGARSTSATNFAGQWLRLRNLEAVNPNARLYPDFDDNLRQAFRQETELFFDHVLREDRSVLELIRADYTFLNERLASTTGFRMSTAAASAA